MIGKLIAASFLTIAISQIAFALPPNAHLIGKFCIDHMFQNWQYFFSIKLYII